MNKILLTGNDGEAGSGDQTGAAPAVDADIAQTPQSSPSPPEGQVPTPEEDRGQQREGAPESYEFKAAEGKQFDNTILDAYSEVARELNLSQEAAQKVLDKVAPVIQARQVEQIAAVQSAWEKEARSDKEFGGDKLDENLGIARRALDEFGSPELKKILNESGLGNHPEIIRALWRVGKATGGDGMVSGRPARDSGQTMAQRMYPGMNP